MAQRSMRQSRTRAIVAVAVLWSGASIASAADQCADCTRLEAELAAAKAAQGALEQTIERTTNELAENDARQAELDRRRSEISTEIEGQRETFVSTDADGATVRSEYDLATGERVTTRTPPNGQPTEIGREPSNWLQRLLAERAQIDRLDADLEAAAAALNAEKSNSETALPAARQRVVDLAAELDACRTRCGQSGRPSSTTLDLLVDRAYVMEFRIPSGGNVEAATAGLVGAVVFPIPAGAGGGFQVAVPVPADAAAAAALRAQLEALAAQGLITDLQTTPCRKFLPEATSSGTTSGVQRTQRNVQIIKGTARTSTGAELGQAVVILIPPPTSEADDEDEDEDDDGTRWIPGVDDQPPALGVPDPDGNFVIIVPDGYRGPFTVMLAPICNCATTTKTHDQPPEVVPVDNETTTTESPESPATTPPPEEEQPETCYCGPDITSAIAEAINRAQSRIDQLPSNEVGFVDGFQFLYRNADAFDAPVAPVIDPTIDPASVAARGNWLCPSGVCARMGQVPFMFAGYCLPKHMSNEILAAFVASGVGVPLQVFSAGANVKQVLNYGSIEGDAPFIAYMIGYRLQSELEDVGSLTPAQVEKVTKDVLETSLFGYFQNYAAIVDEYPTLEQCMDCPYDVQGRFTKDFTTKPWRLADGTRVGEESVDEPMSEMPVTDPVKPPLKPGMTPQSCETGSQTTAPSPAPADASDSDSPSAGDRSEDGTPTGTTSTPDPADQDWGGKQNGEVVDCCTLLKNVLAEIEATPFGQSARGKGIIDTVKTYLCSDITFAMTRDGRVLANGPPLPATDDATGDGDLVYPGDARYERSMRMGIPGAGGFHSNEIYIGLDQSSRGIARASMNPSDYYICDHDGELAVIEKRDLVHNLIHEGLHATLAGKYNVSGRASIEEELDAFNAGNEANAAMGLPPSTDRPGSGYGAASNPSYPNYTGQ